MSRRTTALLIVIMVLLYCCFSLVLGLSIRPPAFLRGLTFSGADLTRPAVADLRNSMTTQVRANDITIIDGASQGCQIQDNNLVVPEGVTCRFGIVADENQTRQLTLSVEAPTQSVDSFLEQIRAVSVDKQLVRGERPYPYDIFRNENAAVASLTLNTCNLEKEPVAEGTPVPKGNCLLKIGR